MIEADDLYSQTKFYERVALWQAQDAIARCEPRHRKGRLTEVALYRFINDVLLQNGKQTLSVKWGESTVANAKTGEQLSYNTFITNHRLSAQNVAQVAQAGRGRWKIENENNNVLKTKGDHLEHNFGHGKQCLSATLLSLHMLAFLFHTVLEWSDETYAFLRHVLARRQTFFEDIRALTRYVDGIRGAPGSRGHLQDHEGTHDHAPRERRSLLHLGLYRRAWSVVLMPDRTTVF